ncbi:MAG: hypothetical protein RR902_02775, partial [Oscillospiraceae bacterium]
MKASTIFAKTMKFVWLKLGLGMATFLGSVVLMAILGGIAFAAQNSAVTYLLLLIWLLLVGVTVNIVNHYFGYMVKAGHVAIVTQAAITGEIPDDQFDAAKKMVSERFVTSNVYFLVNGLVNGAVHQLQRGVDAVDSMLGDVPGISTLLSVAKAFIGIALGYVDECCLGYTFYKKEQGACKSAADAVVIYFQNWKTLMKNALILSIVVVAVTFVCWLVIMLALVGIVSSFNPIVGWIAVFLAFILAAVIKTAFVDSYIMVKMVVSFMEVAPTTEIEFNL